MPTSMIIVDDFFDNARALCAAATLGFPSAKSMVDEILDCDSLDETKWELTQRVPMRFNRLLLLRPWLWHTAGETSATPWKMAGWCI